MTGTRRSAKLLGLLAASALVIAACGGDDGGSDSTTPDETSAPGETDAPTTEAPVAGVEGGTLIWAHEQEPPDLHLDDPNNNLTATSWIRQSLWEGLYGISAATTFIPELLAEEAVMTDNGDGSFTASYKLRDGLMWSDGEAMTADDVKYTFDMIMAQGTEDADEDGNMDYIYLLGDRTGLDTITDFTVASPTEFSITWSAYYGGWKGVFSEVHPKHVFPADPAEAAAAENAALPTWTLEDGTVLPSSGPLVFDSWEKGVKMTLLRNEKYHGSVSPDVTNQGAVAHVDGVQINFVADTDAQVNALKADEAQIIMTQPQLQFEELSTSEDFTVAASAGPVFEHWGFNLNNVHLAHPEVREAIALALNKAEVMEGLYTPLFGDLLPAAGLGNTYWMSNQPTYVDHQTEAGYGLGDADAAMAKLEEAGYTKGSDGIYENEDGKLSLRVGTTGGNRLREIQQELIQAQMKAAGIDITINNTEGGAYFSEQPFSDDALKCANTGGKKGDCNVWDITQFAWVGGPWPGGQSASYRTASGNNPYGYANADFDAKSDECDAIVDEAEAADCYNELDTFVTTLTVDAETGLFMLPLTQKPSFYAYSNKLSSAAVAPDANSAGPLVNVVDFQFAS